MIAIVHSIYSQSVHAPALDARLMDNDAERYCIGAPSRNKIVSVRSRRAFKYDNQTILKFTWPYLQSDNIQWCLQ